MLCILAGIHDFIWVYPDACSAVVRVAQRPMEKQEPYTIIKISKLMTSMNFINMHAPNFGKGNTKHKS